MHTIEKLINYKDQTGEAWMVIARGIGVSAAAIHGVLREHRGEKRYGGDTEGLFKKIEDWLVLQHLRENEPKPVPFVETSSSRAIWKALEYAWIQRKMISITGYAGRGKTRAIDEWSLNHQKAISIDMYASCNNTLFFGIIARILKIEAGISAGKIIEQVVRKLYGSDSFLIIDNAHNLQFNTFDNLRYIHEQSKIGIAMCGTPYLLERMTGSNLLQWEQIYSRLAVRHEVNDLKLSDTKRIVSAVAHGVGENFIKKAHNFAGGSTRELINYLERKRNDFSKGKMDIDFEDFGLSEISTAKPIKREEMVEV